MALLPTAVSSFRVATIVEVGEAQTMSLQDRSRPTRAIVAINSGSSSLKLTIFAASSVQRLAAATVDRIGVPGTRLRIEGEPDEVPVPGEAPGSLLDRALDRLQQRTPFTIAAVGHRVVHGGAAFQQPVRISAAVVDELSRLEPLDPIHMPASVALIREMTRRHPDLPQVACFDTAFHASMSHVARMLPLPRRIWDAGVRRYGFHGLSCESIMGMLRARDRNAAMGRLLIAHLGNGASITAVNKGASVDTTMGFSPLGGLMMGTRTGDLDPGVMTFLARTEGADASALARVVGRESGLLGVSGDSPDMRDLLERSDQRAREAVELFCYTARKHAAALTAVLGGLDTIVFTGGIGEHAPAVRAAICDGLTFLGVRLDADANAAGRDVISAAGTVVTVRVMQTDEDLIIASHTRALC